jgi:hypothetical protein
MRIDGLIIKRIFFNKMKVKVSDQIFNTNLGLITDMCVLNEFGIFFF